MVKIATIICTKDRPVDLKTLLDSISNQVRKPDQVIIVDGSDHSVENIAAQFLSSLKIDYIHLRPPGLTRQRNRGLTMVNSDIDWVGFLDDDLVLEKDCLKNLENFVINDKELKGVGLTIKNQESLRKSIIDNLFRFIFFTDKKPGGVITKSGKASAIRVLDCDQKVEWIYGGATFWHKSIIKKFSFDEWFSGVGYVEDVDFSYRVSRENKLMVCAKARCDHYHHGTRKERYFDMGTWHFVAWWYFILKNPDFNKLLVLWSMFGMMLSNFVFGALSPSSYRLRSGLGNLKGLFIILSGRVLEHKGFQK